MSNLTRNQISLLSKMKALYEHNKASLRYQQDIAASGVHVAGDDLILQVASFAFNTNILMGKTCNLIQSTFIPGLNSKVIVYSLADNPWTFIIHGTCYNLPIMLLDLRKWVFLKNEIFYGMYIPLNVGILRLKLHLLASGALQADSRIRKKDLFIISLNTYLMRIFYVVVCYPLRLIRNLVLRSKSSVSEEIRRYKADCSVLFGNNQQINVSLDRSSSDSTPLSLLTKETDSFGHYLWNDALGMANTSCYVDIPNNIVHVEGAFDFSSSCAIITSEPQCLKIPFSDQGINVSINHPLLLLRTIPVLKASACKLAINLYRLSSSSTFSNTEPASKQRLETATVVKPSNNRFVVFTLRLGARPWLNSLESITTLAHYMAGLLQPTCILIDGMTFYKQIKHHDRLVMNDEIILSQAIQRRLKSLGFTTHIITGLDLRSKLDYFRHAQLFVQTMGSANQLSSWILRKPLITFGDPKFISKHAHFTESFVEHPSQVLVVPSNQDPDGLGYTINATSVINAVEASGPFKNGLLAQK